MQERSLSSSTLALATIALALGVSGVACSGDDTSSQGGLGDGTPDASLTCPESPTNTVIERMQVSGTNGVFVDHCNAAGDLVSYGCGTILKQVCEDGGCEDKPYPSDIVEETLIDCAGTCIQGRCWSRCPRTDDKIEYGGVLFDGRHLVKDLTAGWDFKCTLKSQDCALPPEGTTDNVGYYSAANRTCVGSDTAALSFALSGAAGVDCVFLCTADPPPSP